MNKKIIVEVCANSVESAIAARTGGADRIELCSSLCEGGVTPSYGTIEITRSKLDIPVHVLIRPRGGDFLYNNIEFSVIRRDIELCRKMKIDGIVIGMLDKNGNVDVARMHEVVNMARPMSVTFHRAFDVCSDPYKALQFILGLGIDRILTSGQKNRAIDGIGLLAELVKKAAGKVKIMAGAGINRSNITDLILNSGVQEVHLSGKKIHPSPMLYRNAEVSIGRVPGLPDYSMEVTDAEEIRLIKNILGSYAHQDLN